MVIIKRRDDRSVNTVSIRRERISDSSSLQGLNINLYLYLEIRLLSYHELKNFVASTRFHDRHHTWGNESQMLSATDGRFSHSTVSRGDNAAYGYVLWGVTRNP